jgi:hypothetical protein
MSPDEFEKAAREAAREVGLDVVKVEIFHDNLIGGGTAVADVYVAKRQGQWNALFVASQELAERLSPAVGDDIRPKCFDRHGAAPADQALIRLDAFALEFERSAPLPGI